MSRKPALLAGAAAALAALLLVRRRREPPPAVPPPPDPRAEELRRKLAQARETPVDESEFEAAGMAGETIVEEEPLPPPASGAGTVDEARRRVHEEARASADEMRRAAGPGEA